ncbi:MAG: hypothetical protein GC168_15215 [Candidatus Hydrogenedens sp.]|nr:hypothetical protein [Candidatus Hydrogenedens sp.]
MSSDHSRAHRFRVTLAPAIIDHFHHEQGAWKASPHEERCRERHQARCRVLMAWVEERIPRLLTNRERQCIDLYFYRGMSYREIGEATSTNKSSAFRGVERALRKLREERDRDRSWEAALAELERCE